MTACNTIKISMPHVLIAMAKGATDILKLNESELQQLTSFKAAETLVHQVKHNLEGPFQKLVPVAGGFTFIRSVLCDKHMINIGLPSANFDMTVGVVENRDVCDVIGFYLIRTSGSVSDVEQAINATRHLW